MAITSGFFNSFNGDRKYNAEQMSSLFNGIITDGVFENIGEKFAVKAAEDTSPNVTVYSGRAWLGGIWLNSDGPVTIACDSADVASPRTDAIILESDKGTSSRTATIKFAKGNATTGEKPVMTKNELVTRFPIAYIHRDTGRNTITQSDIEYVVGTSECPFITSILQTTNIDALFSQWRSQWNDWSRDSKAGYDVWFAGLKDMLDSDTEAKLANGILELRSKFTELDNDHMFKEPIIGSDNDFVKDSSGSTIIGAKSVFATMADLSNEIAGAKNASASNAYPVGAIYMSMEDTSPASIFGGTWEQIKDRFLLSAGDTCTAGNTGGEATHTLSVSEMPAHSHTANQLGWAEGSTPVLSRTGSWVAYDADNSYALRTGISSSGGGQPHNNMPPYLAVYMWRRVG